MNNNIIDIFPAILGTFITGSWLIYKLDRNQAISRWLNKSIKDENGILIPSILFIASPFLFTILFNYLVNLNQQGSLIEILRSIFPLFSFILGQFFTEHRKQEEIKNREKTAILEIYEKFESNLRTLSRNKEELNRKVSQANENIVYEPKLMPLEDISSELGKLTSFQGLIPENKRQAKDSMIIAAREAVESIKDFKSKLEYRSNYKSKIDTEQLRENIVSSVDPSQQIDEEKSLAYRRRVFNNDRELEEIDDKLLQITEKLLEIHDEFFKSLRGTKIWL